MLNLHLTRGNCYEGVYLRLPATPGEVGEVFGWLDEIDTEAPTKIIDIVSNIPNLFRYLCHADIDTDGMLGKLQQIAAKTNGLDSLQRDILIGALDAESISGPDDIISVIDRLDEYAFIPNVTCDKELGGYLVEAGYMDVPSRLRPYLDYHGIGTEYYADHGGAYTDKGYVLRKSALEPDLEPNRGTVFRVHLQNPHSKKQHLLTLPATFERMAQVRDLLEVDHIANAGIISVECMIPCLENLIPIEEADIRQLDELADLIADMQTADGELLKFCAALEAERPCLLMDAVDIADDLDNYERITEGTYEYGQSVLRRHGADNELLHMDFGKLGEDAMLEDGVRQTEFGLIRRLSKPFPEQGYEQTMG